MLSEQQQRILGYFIEEAKDHLNTIEQGLLSLQSTIEDPEMVSEVFRAAHSVKGGAAMLGLNSIQHTAHRLEDYFKVLKECTVRVDQTLETHLLEVFDALKELLEQLQGPFGLTEDKASEVMAGVEPVFQALNQHLGELVSQSGGTPPDDVELAVPAAATIGAEQPTIVRPEPVVVEASALQLVFKSDVPARLREMLQLFKRPEQPEIRQQLVSLCESLGRAGEPFELSNWVNLLHQARRVIASPDHSFRTLAPVLIKEIKQAQELVLAGRETEISPSETLRSLLPAEPNVSEADLATDADLADLFGGGLEEPALLDLSLLEQGDRIDATEAADVFQTSVDELTVVEQSTFVQAEADGLDFDNLFSAASAQDETAAADLGFPSGWDEVPSFEEDLRNGPEVGMAELNSLADLFEGEMPDLGLSWQEEEILFEASDEPTEGPDLQVANDFSDLFFESDLADAPVLEDATPDDEDLSGLFNQVEQLTGGTDLAPTTFADDDDLADLDAEFLGALPEIPVEAPDPDEFAQFFATPSGEEPVVAPFEAADPADFAQFFGEPPTSPAADAAAVSAIPAPDGENFSGVGMEDLPGVTDAEDQFSHLGEFFAELDEAELVATEDSDGLDAEVAELEALEVPDSMTSAEGAIASFDPTVDIVSSFGFEEDLDEQDRLSLADSSSLSQAGQETAAPEDSSPERFAAEAVDPATGADASPPEPAPAEAPPVTWMDALDSDAGLASMEPAPAQWDTPANLPDDVTSDLWADASESTFDLLDLEPDQAENLAENLVDLAGLVAPEETQTDDTDDANRSYDAVSSTTASPEAPTDDFFAGNDSPSAAESLSSTQDIEDLLGIGRASDSTSDFPGLESGDAPSSAANLTLEHEADFESSFEISDSFESSGPFASTADLDVASDEQAALETESVLDQLDALLGETESLDPGGETADLTAASLDELDALLGQVDEDVTDMALTTSAATFDEPSSVAAAPDFENLESLLSDDLSDLDEPPLVLEPEASIPDDFLDLESMLAEAEVTEAAPPSSVEQLPPVDDFSDLEALLENQPTASSPTDSATTEAIASDDEFDDLERLLENADQTLGGTPTSRINRGPATQGRRPSRPGVLTDQTMRVSVKNLDNLNNLVGELVVNRNSLEQAEERLRQFLDNLLYQVQQLSDVGQRMRDLYERSLLESSLLSSRRTYQVATNGVPSAAQTHATGMSFDALEMDRFTGFHTLSQEMIELIVRVRESASDIDFVVDETDQITRNFRQITTQLQEGLTRSRMVPFAQTADRLPRAVRDISLRCGKQAELTIEGRETLIDKMILEQLYDPMTHLVNNAITHGIETPEERVALGKPPVGKITVRTFHQGNQTVISVMDDGAGIDPERVKAKALEKGLITPEEAKTMSRLDVYDLLFHHGFSTRDRADDFAGRGVGMDVVRTSLNEIRGSISIDSAVGRGTTFTIRLPLTLSISKALCCISNRARIAFPMDGVEDMLDIPRDRIQTMEDGRSCIQWHDTTLPFQHLSDLLKHNRSLGRGSVYGGNQEDDIVSVVVLRSNAGSFLALQVDQVLGEQEIVIKQLEGPVPKPIGIAGATVLGDGRIMPIADVLELIDLSMGRLRRESGSALWDKGEEVPVEPIETKSEPTVLIVDDSITVRELLSMSFNKVGYRVEQARDGQEAWEKLRSGLPCDLVFCDIEMPRMDGLELLSRMQKDPHLNHLPIAMLTSRGADRHRQMAIQLGAKGYFTKPYLEEALLDAAQRMLKGEVLVSSS